MVEEPFSEITDLSMLNIFLGLSLFQNNTRTDYAFVHLATQAGCNLLH